MALTLYPQLSTRSRRSIIKRKYRYGRLSHLTYYYLPRQRLIRRLSEELGLSWREVIDQLFDERLELLRQYSGSDTDSTQVAQERHLCLERYRDLL